MVHIDSPLPHTVLPRRTSIASFLTNSDAMSILTATVTATRADQHRHEHPIDAIRTPNVNISDAATRARSGGRRRTAAATSARITMAPANSRRAAHADSIRYGRQLLGLFSIRARRQKWMLGFEFKCFDCCIYWKIRVIPPDVGYVDQEIPRGGCVQFGRRGRRRRSGPIVTNSSHLLMHDQSESTGRTELSFIFK